MAHVNFRQFTSVFGVANCCCELSQTWNSMSIYSAAYWRKSHFSCSVYIWRHRSEDYGCRCGSLTDIDGVRQWFSNGGGGPPGGAQWSVRGGRERQGRTRRSISTGYLSAALRLRHTSLCVNSHQVRCAACLFRPAPAVLCHPEQLCRTSICLADARAQCSNSAEFCTEQTGSYATK